MTKAAVLLLASIMSFPAAASELAAPIQPVAFAPAQEKVERISKFVYRIDRPENASGRTIVMMHGSGGDETTLAPLAAKIDPDAVRVGIRGRVVQEGVKRWYKRITPTRFDQDDIRSEAAAFADFFRSLAKDEAIDLDQTVFLGYSNGANLTAAVSVLYPDLVQRAVLLRSMPVLEEFPQANLQRAKFLTISGQTDQLYAPFAPMLEAMFRSCGAEVVARTASAGHDIGDEDAKIAIEWLAQLKSASVDGKK